MRHVLIAGACLFACEVYSGGSNTADPGLTQRIAQRKNDLLKNPDDVRTILELGDLQLEAEQIFDAADTFASARKRGSDDIRINAGLTNAYFELGYLKSGVEELKGCIEKDRNQPDCLFAYGRLLEEDQSERTKQELRQVWLRFLEVAPDHRKAGYVRSSLEQIEGQLGSRPPPAAQAASPHDPHGGHPPVETEPASEGEQRRESDHGPRTQGTPIPGHPGGAPDSDEAVGELNPFGLAISKAIDAVKRNDAPGAEAAFREALRIHPDDASATAGLAEALLAQNKQDEAVTTIEKAYQLDATDPQVRWAFGLIMMRNQKRMTEAIAAWEALDRDDPEYSKRLGVPARLEQIKKFMTPDGHPPVK